MNCQHASEHNGKNPSASAEPQPMETLDYLRLASFIQYLKNDRSEREPLEDSSLGDLCPA